MSHPLKKQRAVFPIEEYVPEDEEEQEDPMIGQVIDVEFEGFQADDGDFHGIKRLLNQCLRGFDANISGLTDIIISQNYVGSVIKQVSDDDGDYDEDEDAMEEDTQNEVFGVTTVINLTSRREDEVIAGLRSSLVEKCGMYAADSTNQMVRELLGHESKHIGFLLSERLVNLPPQFSIPVFDSLFDEMKKANNSKMPYNFTYYVMICKLYKLKGKKKVNKGVTLDPIMWSNPEEEIFSQESSASFEFMVKGADSGLSGDWDDDDAQYEPWRKVLLISASKLPDIISKVKEAILS